MGGFCWRRWEPRVASKHFGQEYESWQFPGSQAEEAIQRLRRFDVGEVRPSRVDVAFDLVCPSGFTPEEFVESLRSHIESRGIVVGISGSGGVNTMYVGASGSERRIRVYRKDLQELMYAEMFGPTLRVEVELHREQAVAWWRVYHADEAEGLAAAAAHILQMTGFSVCDDVGQVPMRIMPDEADEAESLFQFLNQHAGRLVAWKSAGIPVGELAREHYDVRAGKMAASRRVKRERKLERLGVSEVVEMVRARIWSGREMEAV
jgi:hypothetical protein